MCIARSLLEVACNLLAYLSKERLTHALFVVMRAPLKREEVYTMNMKRKLSSFARKTRLSWVFFSLTIIAALLLAACGGGGTATTTTPTATTPPTPTPTPTSLPSPTPTPKATVVTVKIVEVNGKYAFQPATLSIKMGTQVVWLNTSDAPHTVTSDTSGVFGSPSTLTQNQTFKFTFTSAGTFPYHCNIHPYMKATITVTS
jgi:plastocyanin